MTNLRDTRKEDSAARRALGASTIEANGNVVIETYSRVRPMETPPPRGGPVYTRRGYKAPLGKALYEATGGCGVISVRASATPMRYATDVADPAGPTERQRQGRIRSFFTDEPLALAQADELRAEGLVVNIVPARPYAGQPGDNE